MSNKNLAVELSVEISQDKSYPIYINDKDIETLEESIFSHTKANRILVVISEKVEKLYGKKLNFKNSLKFVLKDGEKEKNFKNYKKILDFALKNKLERKDAFVAIGGGVVGDITGFAAASYLRGVDFIQIPTTLLACVDSSVGGKVGINTDYGKNLVGAFYQPKAVFCNLNFLKTLDERQFKTGLAEVLKYAFIEKSCWKSCWESFTEDSDFFDFLLENSDKILEKNPESLAKIIEISLRLKASVVKQDEKEQGLRKILNFGHTLAHAIEKITDYKKYTHGEAVAMGMDFAINLALRKNLIEEQYRNASIDLLNRYGILKKMPNFSTKKLIELMKSDKKVEDGKIIFVLPSEKAKAEIIETSPEEIYLLLVAEPFSPK